MGKRDAVTGSKPINFTEKFISGFWARVNKKGPIPKAYPRLGRCWLWTGCKDKNGYGGVGSRPLFGDGQNIHVHRVAWMLVKGVIPRGKNVLHKCDNPSCVRLSHLFLGTQLENIADMIRKGRHGHGVTRGEEHPNSKLTWKKVLAIRRLYEEGVRGNKLAKKFRISRNCAWAVATRKVWRKAA